MIIIIQCNTKLDTGDQVISHSKEVKAIKSTSIKHLVDLGKLNFRNRTLSYDKFEEI